MYASREPSDNRELLETDPDLLPDPEYDEVD